MALQCSPVFETNRNCLQVALCRQEGSGTTGKAVPSAPQQPRLTKNPLQDSMHTDSKQYYIHVCLTADSVMGHQVLIWANSAPPLYLHPHISSMDMYKAGDSETPEL